MSRLKNIKLGFWLLSVLSVLKLSGQNPNWTAPNSAEFLSSATAMTAIYLNGIHSNNSGDRIAIFAGNQLRGLSEPVDLGGQQYLHFITVYSNMANELMHVKVYHQASDLVYDVAQPFTFEAQGIYGSIQAPLQLDIYDNNDAPISINTVPFQVTLEGLAFNDIDMEDYLVQPDSQGVNWSFIPNPNLQVAFSGSVLSIEGVSGFSGFTNLTVQATEVNQFTSNKGTGPPLMRAVSNNQAQVVITFYIIPAYDGPLWNTIPGEGIVQGNTFTPVNLHEYENQYGGPAIQYDYVPLLQESDTPVPKPAWSYSGSLQTNMSIIASLDYTPKYQFQHEDDILATFINNEIRGVSKLDTASGLYFISVGGEVAESDSVSIKFYSGQMKKIFEVTNEFKYVPHQIIGSTTQPYPIDLAPIVPVIIDQPIPGGFMIMPVEIRDTTYLGTEYFEFYAFDPDYPEYLNDTTQTSFCIVADLSELVTLYEDADGDGLGNPNVTITACDLLPGYVDNGDDCDDTIPEDPMISITVTENSAGTPNDGFVCSLDTVTLMATGGSSYLWSNGDTTSTITVFPSYHSQYKVTVTLGTCKGAATANLNVEGRIVTKSDNEGRGSLRSVLSCLIEGDTIIYDQNNITFSHITSPLFFDKHVFIEGLSPQSRPEIRLDFTSMTKGLEIISGKALTIENVDFQLLNGVGIPTLVGPGSLFINGINRIR